MNLPTDVLGLLRQPSTCYLATVMPDGAPQVTQTWVDTDGTNVLINSVQGYQKLKNIARDPRVTIAIGAPDDPARYVEVRGRVIDVTTDGATEHIEQLAHKYLGTPYPWYGGRDQVRVIIAIAPDKVNRMG